MFTGIVGGLGRISAITAGDDTKATIETDFDVAGIEIGASIACDGVCLTVIATDAEAEPGRFDVEYSAETLSKTNLGLWAQGRVVNLERSLKLGDEMGGHIVSGHVDGLAVIREIEDIGGSTRIAFEAPQHLSRFIAQKGSVALNGTSLTVNDVIGNVFEVNLIPHTKEVTTWGTAVVGDEVNLEIDTVARYVARLNEFGAETE